jgi:hypothetical protein
MSGLTEPNYRKLVNKLQQHAQAELPSVEARTLRTLVAQYNGTQTRGVSSASGSNANASTGTMTGPGDAEMVQPTVTDDEALLDVHVGAKLNVKHDDAAGTQVTLRLTVSRGVVVAVMNMNMDEVTEVLANQDGSRIISLSEIPSHHNASTPDGDTIGQFSVEWFNAMTADVGNHSVVWQRAPDYDSGDELAAFFAVNDPVNWSSLAYSPVTTFEFDLRESPMLLMLHESTASRPATPNDVLEADDDDNPPPLLTAVEGVKARLRYENVWDMSGSDAQQLAN